MENSQKEISNRLKQSRINKGYRSARAFAIKNGFPYLKYSRHEAGTNKISPETLIQYAEKLNVDAGWLFSGKMYGYEFDSELNSLFNENEFDQASLKIDVELLSIIFEEIKNILLNLKTKMTDKEKILICAEIYNKVCNSEDKTKAINDLLGTVEFLVRQILMAKVS